MVKMNLNQFGGTGPNRRINPRSKIQDEDTFISSNKWVKVISSNVRKIRYEKAAQKMWVGFKDGSIYYCPSFTVAEAKKYFRAMSMGKNHWRLRRLGYVFIKFN